MLNDGSTELCRYQSETHYSMSYHVEMSQYPKGVSVMRQWIRTVCTIAAVASFLPLVSATAQESDDHQAIRKLFQQEQEGWRTADGAQILSCFSEDFVNYNIPIRNDQPNFLQVHIASGSHEDLKERVLAEDFQGMKAALADTARRMEHSYELNHINVDGDEGVAISTIAWAWVDTTRDVRVQRGHQTMWLLRKLEGDWKYVGAVFPISAYTDETP